MGGGNFPDLSGDGNVTQNGKLIGIGRNQKRLRRHTQEEVNGNFRLNNFDLDVAEIIEEAYERCGLEVRTAYDAKTARRSLNLMFADWANRGLNLWTVKQGTQALTQGTATYTFNATYTDLLEVVLRRSGVDFELTRMSRSEYLAPTKQNNTGSP